MASTCAGCLKNTITGRLFLTCAKCKDKYDLECAQVSTQRFYNTMTRERKNQWTCPSCACKTPKSGNTNRPIHHHDTSPTKQVQSLSESLSSNENQSLLGDTLIDIELNKTCNKNDFYNENVTIRKQRANSNNGSPPINRNILNEDTNYDRNSLHYNKDNQAEFTLQTLSEIIALRLKENNQSIISELQNTIQTEIYKAITKLKEDFKQKTDTFILENKDRKADIAKINTNIELLQKENQILKQEISELHKRLHEFTTGTSENNKNKIVLYGLIEYYQETESDLHTRIVDVFRNILNINLEGYIEETYRIGKYNNKNRPLVIDLLSKKMAKYIIQNNRHFYGSGLSISEHLDENARKERRYMREEMFMARRKGLHAIIRNNQLFIEGKKMGSEYYSNSPYNQNMNDGKEAPNIKNDKNINSNTGKNSTFRKRPTI